MDALIEATVDRPPLSTAGEADPFAGWDDIPLFMKSLPTELGGQPKDGDAGGSQALEALQALMYDGEPSEIAADLKAQGNDLFAAKKYRDALGFYTRALDEVGADLPVEERRVLWSNRAAANLELRNFGATLRDVSLILSAPLASYPEPPSLAWNKTTLKALLRSARALSGLEKLPEALDALKRLRILEVDMGEGDKDVGKVLLKEVEGKIEKKERKLAETKEKARRVVESDRAMREALALRGVKLPKGTSKALFATCPIDITPPHFDPTFLPPSSLPSHPLLPSPSSSTPYTPFTAPATSTPLIFPTFLLLPHASPPTRDLCLSFHTSSTFAVVLESMEHDPSQLQLYIATVKGRVLKVGAKLTLEKVLAAAGGSSRSTSLEPSEKAEARKFSEPASELVEDADEALLLRLGYRQEFKREFSRFSTISFAFSVMGVTSSIAATFNTPMLYGGPASVVWCWFIGTFGCFCLGTSIAEIISAYPTDGGLYSASAYLVPKKYRGPVGWVVGWLSLTGQISAVASGEFAVAGLILAAVSISTNGEFVPTVGQTYGLFVGLLAIHASINSLATRALAKITQSFIFINLGALVAICIACLVTCKDFHPASYLFTTAGLDNQTGWSSNGLSFLFGILSVSWTMTD
ncbi:hypothetical protein RQP46_008589 [Phenoliferia psychrophenolica]